MLPRGIVATFISGLGLGICSILDLTTSTDAGAATGIGAEAAAGASPGSGGADAASFGITGVVGGGGGGGTEAVFGSAIDAPTGPDVETGVDKTAGSLLCTEGCSALTKKLT